MLAGKGSITTLLSESEVFDLCGQAFDGYGLHDKRILAIIPDHTRTVPMDMMFRVIYSLLAARVRRLDFIIALGTHPLLSEESIYRRVGITRSERSSKYPKARFFNHHWNDPRQLKTIGTISEDEVAHISGGLMRQAVDVSINKMVFDYDLLMIVGPTFPHEVVGFSGGNKYLFPGIAGQNIIDMFHWLGALITNPVINGTKDTPVRTVVDRAASFLLVDRICISLVVKDQGLAGVFIGSPEEAFSAAADLSGQVHIIRKHHPYHRVLSCAPAMYEDMWLGGKCAYKLEPVVADGGELIIYAPHIKEVSVTHGATIEKIGYHVLDYFTSQMDKFRDIPGGVLAHSTHVKGAGTYLNGVERPRINVTLATSIPETVSRRINLGYVGPEQIHIDQWRDREDEGILYVPKAGEMLFRLENDPFTEL